MARRSAPRWLRHLACDDGKVRRAFDALALSRIEQAIAAGERTHRGQVRFAVEAALPLARVLAGVSPRERALEVFSLSRTWDTEENCGVLVYLLFADRDVEIVADRGIHARVADGTWQAICSSMEDAFSAGRFAEGVESGMAEIGRLLAQHFPRATPGGNELPDSPLIL